MLSFLKNVIHSILDEELVDPLERASTVNGENRRQEFRFSLVGVDITVRAGGTVSTMQLRDLSCTGLAGITDLAVPIDGTILIMLPSGKYLPAKVRWFRNTTMGVKFVRPLDLETVLRLHAMRWDKIAGLLEYHGEAAAPPEPVNEN